MFYFDTALLNWRPFYFWRVSDKLKLRMLFSSYSFPFWVKEKANTLRNEIKEVEELDKWQPAIPLIHSLFPPGGLKSLQRIA